MRAIMAIFLALILPFVVACGGDDSPLQKGETAVGGVATATPTAAVSSTLEPSPTPTPEAPAPTTQVLFMGINEEFEVMRFAATVHNPSARTLEGVRLRWDAIDASGALVGSFKSVSPSIPPGGIYVYVGGAGGANLTGTPASVTLTVEGAGRLTDAAVVPLAVAEVEMAERPYLPGQWDVSFLVTTGAEEIAREGLHASVLLKDADGNIVGADWAVMEAGPDKLPPGTKLRLKAEFIGTEGVPASAEAFAYVRPQ